MSERYNDVANSLLNELAQRIELDEDDGTVTTDSTCRKLVVNALESAYAAGAASRDREIAAAIQAEQHAKEQLAAAKKRVVELEAAVYHTAPGELEFGGEGWTWKQQARANEDRLHEAEQQIKSLERAIASAVPALERCGLIAVSDTLINALNTPTPTAQESKS